MAYNKIDGNYLHGFKCFWSKFLYWCSVFLFGEDNYTVKMFTFVSYNINHN